MVLGKLHKFFSMPFELKMLFIEAFFIQNLTWLILKIVPFRTILMIYSNPGVTKNNPGNKFMQDLKTATDSANAISIYKNKCLVQSLTARLMLKRRYIGSTISLGFSDNGKKKHVAHASITADGVDVVSKGSDYKELYTF